MFLKLYQSTRDRYIWVQSLNIQTITVPLSSSGDSLSVHNSRISMQNGDEIFCRETPEEIVALSQPNKALKK